jgi:hypothetical protein
MSEDSQNLNKTQPTLGARRKTKIRKALVTAFCPSTPPHEANTAFLKARGMLASSEISILEILLPGWGGGPLVVALQKVGGVLMTTGKYIHKSLEWIMAEDPAYLVRIKHAGGLAAGPCNDAINILYTAYMSDLICRFTGGFEDNFSVDQWDENKENAKSE